MYQNEDEFMIKTETNICSGLRILNLMQRENKFSYLIDRYLFLFSAQILFNFSETILQLSAFASQICILIKDVRYLNGKTTQNT